MTQLAKRLYSINPTKLSETAKGKTYEQFILYLQAQPNFTIINMMSESDQKELYILSIVGK